MSLVKQTEEIKARLLKNVFPIIWGKSVEEWAKEIMEKVN